MSGKERIYLDYHATTPVDPDVLETMLPYFSGHFGNPASRSHSWGWDADAAVSRARTSVAQLIGARSPREIVFTSGATESNNLVLKGIQGSGPSPTGHIITSAIEHGSVLKTCQVLEGRGVRVTRVPVGPDGRVNPASIEAAITKETRLISIMMVNNEVGTIQPILAIGRIAKRHGVLLHTDASQAVGRIGVDVQALGVDLLSLSAHKIYGPKGVGACYIRRFPQRVSLSRNLMDGGDQEYGQRAGTVNVPGVVGFGRAAELAKEKQPVEARRLADLRNRLLERLAGEVSGVTVHGSLQHRVSGNLSLSFEGIEADPLISALPNLALSAGSACTSAKMTISHVLAAMGVPERTARGAIRIGLGRFTTEEHVSAAADRIAHAALRIRKKEAN